MRPFKKKQPFLKNISLRLALAVLLTAALTLTGCSGGGKTSPQEFIIKCSEIYPGGRGNQTDDYRNPHGRGYHRDALCG